MKRYINDDFKVKHGGRKAICLTEKELENKIIERAIKVDGGIHTRHEIDLQRALGILQSDDSVIIKDMKYMIDQENLEVRGYKILSNGLTVLVTEQGGDWELPAYVIYYYDGKNVRCYVPTKGNLVNADCKTAFGSEQDSESVDLDKLVNKYKKAGFVNEADLVDDDCSLYGYDLDFMGIYLGKYGLTEETAEINEIALFEEVTTRIEIIK